MSLLDDFAAQAFRDVFLESRDCGTCQKDCGEAYHLFAHILMRHKFPVAFPPQIHRGFRDTGEAYDASQTSEWIHDGDILVSGQSVAVLVEAWPTIVKGPQGEFHAVSPEFSWEKINDGRYTESYAVAMALETS